MARVNRSVDPLLEDDPQKTKSPIDIMDEALFFLHHLIDTNIEMQELIIEIRRCLIDSERQALQFLHFIIRKAERLKIQLATKLQQFRQEQQKGTLPKQLFIRFYGRVSQKIFKKFLYFSLNSKDLQFTKQNLLDLYYFTDELKNAQSLTNFNHLIGALSLIVNENRQFIDVLLEQIVESNYVSSLQEFAHLKGMKLEEYTKQLEVKKEQIEEEQWNQYITPFQTEVIQKKKLYAKHRGGRIFQKNFKQELEVLLSKYQDTRQRDAFMEIISKEIEKDNDRDGIVTVQMSQKKRLRFNTPDGRDGRIQMKEIRRKSNKFYKKYFQNDFVHPIWNPLAAETQQNDNFTRKASRKETKIAPKQDSQSNSQNKIQNPSSDNNLLEQLTQMNIEQQHEENPFQKKKNKKPRLMKTMLPNQKIARQSKKEERDSRKQLKQIVDTLINDIPQIQKTESSQQSSNMNIPTNMVSGLQRSVQSYVQKFEFELDSVVNVLRTSKQLYFGEQSGQNTNKIIKEIQRSLLSKKPLMQEDRNIEQTDKLQQFKTEFNCQSENQTKCTSKVSTAYMKKRVMLRTKSANPVRNTTDQVVIQRTESKENTMRFWTCFQVQPDQQDKQVKIPAKPARQINGILHFREFFHTNLRKIYFATKS